MTCDMLGGDNSQKNVSFLTFKVWELKCFENIPTNDDLLNESINDEGLVNMADFYITFLSQFKGSQMTNSLLTPSQN